jgi:hypothetical protein
MSIAIAWQQCLAYFRTLLVIEPSLDQLSRDTGPANGGGGRQLCRTIVLYHLRKKITLPHNWLAPVRPVSPARIQCFSSRTMLRRTPGCDGQWMASVGLRYCPGP